MYFRRGLVLGLVGVCFAVMIGIRCGGGTGSVTISGTLTVANAHAAILTSGRDATAAAGYKIQILNAGTGTQGIAETAADGKFSIAADKNNSYIINVLDSNFRYVGTLVTNGAVASDTASIGLKTGAGGSVTTLGAVTVDAETAHVVSDQTLNADSDHVAHAPEGVLAGGGVR